jgi:DNA-binding SARP family transcriptional activator/tetratricopeptide (TPR) repeat protein
MPASRAEVDVTARAPDEPRIAIRVLGPVEVVAEGRPVDLGGVKARALIARLLVDRGLVVSVDRLVDSLWGDGDGQGAEIALRSTISRLRKRLRGAGAPEDVIVTRAPGYLLDVPADVTDVFAFEQLLAEGRRQLARLHPAESMRLLTQAQGLWRGTAYSEVRDEPFARAEARRLEELLLTAIESRIDAGLTMGRHAALVGELESLTSANPLRERLWSQRMLALYRSGRQAEALRVFQDLRSILVAELGIEPGHDVAWLEHAILNQDPALDFPVPVEPASVATHIGETPADPTAAGYRVRIPTPTTEGALVGRDQETALLREWWTSVRNGDSRLLLVDGDSGIGKTCLVGDLARVVEGEGSLVLWGRCDEDPVAPFQPFAEALGHYFHVVSADQISQMPEWQLTELSRLVVRLREHVPMFGDEAADPDSERFRFFEAVTATLGELSEDGVLLVVDDLHWADRPTLLLLRHVLRNVEHSKLGVVGIFIDTEAPADHRLRSLSADFRADRSLEAVHLEGLGLEGVEELVRTWPKVPSDLAAQLFKLTDGNPLFLDELLRQLSEREASSDGGGGDDSVPPDLSPSEAIRELVARRVSRLPQDVIYLLDAAAVAGPEFEASIVAEAADLTPDQRLDAFDRAEESRLLRRIGGDVLDRYAFTHALVREAIYSELLRGRRARYHHKVADAIERVHADSLDKYVNELAHHYYLGAALADADKAISYCMAAGSRALRLLAFEDAVGHFSRGLEVAERYGPPNQATRCDTLIALAEAQNRAGDSAQANASFERAATLARDLDDGERLATAALRAGPLNYLGIVGANEDQVRLLEEARSTLPEEDSHLRAMVSARLGLLMVSSARVPAPGVVRQSLAHTADAIAMARRMGDRTALGYALNARMHALWGIEPAPERLAAGTELGEIAADVGDELLALQGHMWRIRELLAQGDVDAVSDELARFQTRDTGPVHPLAASYGFNVEAMMASISGDFDRAEWLGEQALAAAEGYNDMALSYFGALMIWTWWQRGELAGLEHAIHDVIAQAPSERPMVQAAHALTHAEAGQTDEALSGLEGLSSIGWEAVADDQTEGAALALSAAVCGALGPRAGEHAALVYDLLRPYAGTAVVIRAPAAACLGPADQYLGLAASSMGDLALAEVHFEASLRLARRMRSDPFIAAAEVELARTMRQRGREGEQERAALLLRSAEESALKMGLHRLARRAADPG